MDSEEESDSEEVEEESEEESDSGVASLALASAFVAKSIFNHEDNGYVTDTENCDDDDDYAPTYCFMAKGSKVSSRSSHSDTSEDESDDNLKPSYSKLVKIATKQQHAMERIQNLLERSDDLLAEEMDSKSILN